MTESRDLTDAELAGIVAGGATAPALKIAYAVVRTAWLASVVRDKERRGDAFRGVAK